MRTSPATSEWFTTRAKPWRPSVFAADGNSPTKCVAPARSSPDFTEILAGADARLMSISTRTGCGGGAGSGVEAYIVLGIRACACSRAICRRRSACNRATCAARRSKSRAAPPIASRAHAAPGAVPSASATSIALANAWHGRLGSSMFLPPDRDADYRNCPARNRAIVKSGVRRVGHAAALLSSMSSIPSLNRTPWMTFASCRNPRSRRQDFSAHRPIL